MKKYECMMNHKELLLTFEKTLVSSGILINSIEKCEDSIKNFYQVKIIFKNKQLNLFVDLRNISSAYLPNKPYILRRQVGKLEFDAIPINDENSLSMLIGITCIDDKIILVCWNPFYFIGHSTNRSCYVLESSLEEAKQFGLYDGNDCRTPVLVCLDSCFDKMLDIYVERNVVD